MHTLLWKMQAFNKYVKPTVADPANPCGGTININCCLWWPLPQMDLTTCNITLLANAVCPIIIQLVIDDLMSCRTFSTQWLFEFLATRLFCKFSAIWQMTFHEWIMKRSPKSKKGSCINLPDSSARKTGLSFVN